MYLTRYFSYSSTYSNVFHAHDVLKPAVCLRFCQWQCRHTHAQRWPRCAARAEDVDHQIEADHRADFWAEVQVEEEAVAVQRPAEAWCDPFP